MTRFEFFESGFGLMGVRLGLISTLALEQYDMYKTYLTYLDQYVYLPEHQAVAKAKQATQGFYHCEYYTVRRAIVSFEEGKVLQISVNGHHK